MDTMCLGRMEIDRITNMFVCYFSDDSDLDDELIEAKIKPKSRRNKSVSRYDDDGPSLMHRKPRKQSDDDDNDSLSSKNDPFKRSSKSSKSKRRSAALDSDDDL
jgi:hypothetical protein